MKLYTKLLTLALCACWSSFAAIDQDPLSNGTTMARNASGHSFEAGFHNPALLGVDQAPTSGALLFPVSDIGIGLWSDKLALSWFDPYGTSDSLKRSKLLSNLLARSFNITDEDNADPTGKKVSDKLTKGFKGGFKIYGGARTTLLNYTSGRIGVDVTTHLDEQINMPEGPLYMLFSNDQGLLRGKTLDFSSFRQQGIFATDITFSVGLPVSIPALHEFFGLPYGAGGVGIKYIMGHAMLNAQMDPGSVTYKTADNKIGVDGQMKVQAAGDFVSKDFLFDNPFKSGLPVNGHGIGLDLGGILYDENARISVNFQNLGVLFWINNTRELTKKIKKDGLDFYDIVDGFKVAGYNQDKAILTIFDRNSGQYLSDAADTFQTSSGFVTTLPLTANFGYSRQWNFNDKNNKRLSDVASYGAAAINYEQALAGGPGLSYVPRLSLGGELGTAKGHFPLRLGLILGGPEQFASAAGFGINFNYFSIQFSYKAIGNMLLVPRNGMELAGGLNVNWGMKAPEHRKPLPPPPPVHDTLRINLYDTLVKKDTVIRKDTVKTRDTIIQLKLRPTEKEEKALTKELKGVNFQTASAELTTDSYAHLGLIVGFLKKYQYLRYEIQGHTDSRGDENYNLLLSAARAASVRNYLTNQGIPDSSIIAIGYGKTKPIASNNTAAGRALNRRVQFVVIETEDDYMRLKMLEAQFQERVKAAEIKGVR